MPQRTVERYVKGQLKRPRQELRDRMEREVRKRWQPQVPMYVRNNSTRAHGRGVEFSSNERIDIDL
ncbi:hypothetical protein ACGFOM_38380 [Streptomyces sp. NPDC048594]|uniref:hypothetical protein n=1 Tax=Streptomyces sp. NPDC048594 TaxID=3365575 RepID=UPI0037205F3C